MLKLEPKEVAIIQMMLLQSKFEGKDVMIIAKLLEKINKEMEKLVPDTL